jgi:hypothetical protein
MAQLQQHQQQMQQRDDRHAVRMEQHQLQKRAAEGGQPRLPPPSARQPQWAPQRATFAAAVEQQHSAQAQQQHQAQQQQHHQMTMLRDGRHAARIAQQQLPVHNRFDALSLLVGDEAEELIGAVAIETPTTGKIVEAVIDSGAVHSVTPLKLFPGRVTPSPWSRAGRGYRAANGTRIANLGQVQVPFATAEGHRCQIPFQVADVEQPLISVAHLTEAGNRVELGETEGRILNLSTGRTIALERRGRVYIMKMYIPDVAAAPFGRQGA